MPLLHFWHFGNSITHASLADRESAPNATYLTIFAKSMNNLARNWPFRRPSDGARRAALFGIMHDFQFEPVRIGEKHGVVPRPVFIFARQIEDASAVARNSPCQLVDLLAALPAKRD